MTSAAVLAILAFGHVLSAMGWLGGGFLTTFVLGPNLMNLSPAARLEYNVKVLPRILRFLQVSIGLTLLFGVLLLYAFYNGDFSFLFKTGQGIELSVGATLALVDAILAWSFVFPSFKRVIQISSSLSKGGQQAPSPDLMKYGNRARIGALVGAVLLLAVLSAMIAAGFGFS